MTIATDAALPRIPGASRQEELLVAASAVFAESGFRNATMEAIAERGSSTKQTVYSRFGSKEALYRACLERETQILQDHMFTVYGAVRTLRRRDRIRASSQGFFRYVESNQVGFAVLLDRQSLGSGAPELRPVEDVLLDLVAADIRAHGREHGHEFGPSLDLLASMMLALAVSAARRCVRTGTDFASAAELTAAAIIAISQLDPATTLAVDRANADRG